MAFSLRTKKPGITLAIASLAVGIAGLAVTAPGLSKSTKKDTYPAKKDSVHARKTQSTGKGLSPPGRQMMVPFEVGTSWTYKFKHSTECGTVEGNAYECEVSSTIHKQTVVDSISQGRINGALIEDRNVEEHQTTEKHNVNNDKLLKSKQEPSPGSTTRYLVRLIFDKSRYYELAEDDRPVDGRSDTLNAMDAKKEPVPPYAALRYWLDLKKKIAAGHRISEPSKADLRMKLPARVRSKWAQECSEGLNGHPLPPRDDDFYCWCVEKIGPPKIAGAVARSCRSPVSRQYSLAYRTNPDHTLREFCPGIGVTNYEYCHHGSVENAYDRLIEFHPGNGERSADLRRAIERFEGAVRGLPRLVDAERLIFEQAEKCPKNTNERLDSKLMTIKRIEKDSVCLEYGKDRKEIGPVAVPEKVAQLLQVGWKIKCALAKSQGKWLFDEVGGVYFE